MSREDERQYSRDGVLLPAGRHLACYIRPFSSSIFRCFHRVTKFGGVANTASACALTPTPQPSNGHCTHQTLGSGEPVDAEQHGHAEHEDDHVNAFNMPCGPCCLSSSSITPLLLRVWPSVPITQKTSVNLRANSAAGQRYVFRSRRSAIGAMPRIPRWTRCK